MMEITSFILSIALVLAVLFLIGMIAVIVLFAKRPKPAAQPPVQNADAAQPLVAKAATTDTPAASSIEPPTYPAVPPEKPAPIKRTSATAVIAAVLSLFLFASLSVNIAFLFYVGALNSRVSVVSAAMQSNTEEMDRILAESDSWKAQCDELESFLHDAAYENGELRRIINYYTECIAFVGEYEGYRQLYHTAWCDDLDQDFYIYTVKEAEMMYCSPCPVCHTSESLDAFIYLDE